MEEALLDGYEYTPDKAINPPDKGVIIINKESKEGCAKAFTPLSFRVFLDEPAKCKLDYLRKDLRALTPQSAVKRFEVRICSLKHWINLPYISSIPKLDKYNP